MKTACKNLSDDLHAAAAQHVAASRSAHTVADEDTRLRNGAQLRFVAALVMAGHLPMGEAWLTASGRLLDSYRAVDLARASVETVSEDLEPPYTDGPAAYAGSERDHARIG